ncbi:MAG: hypothetical protein NC397_09935 [Clostridium sp.]|nr:hypothetical protein [Clostridium sp.]
MAETTKDKKGFNAGVYAVFAGVLVAVVLVIITIFAFTTRYTAFSPEKVAQAYTDTIVQTGDGYNAYKNTLVSKNGKYGDFIRNAYMKPYVNDGDDVKKADFVGTGSNEEAEALNKVYSTMYEYYVELLTTYGLDDYDSVFSNYFAKLAELRKEVYGDEYMDTDFMFGAFESNVSTYGQSLTGTKRTFASDDKTIIQEQSIGTYQTMFGVEQDVEVETLVDGKKKTVTEKQPVYKFTTTVKECTALSDDEVKAYVDEYAARIKPVAESGAAKADSFGLEDTTKEKKILFFTKTEKINNKSSMIDAFAKLDNSADISAVDKCIVEVTLDDGTVVASQELYVVQIGNSWYVDDTNVDTSALYLAK